jgi:hypothetical protein
MSASLSREQAIRPARAETGFHSSTNILAPAVTHPVRAETAHLADDRIRLPAGMHRTNASATSRCRDVCSSRRATPGIAIVGPDRRHDRFGLLGAD